MPALLHQLLSRSAARTPDAVALAHRDTTLTYAQLNVGQDCLLLPVLILGLNILHLHFYVSLTIASMAIFRPHFG